ncbi:uncharacterized protein LOC116347531 [Contarinia nasturtii]|uniref:uncharacterized protein LOC116347531 n=1 Tax=Contarinia nasturtii TaxID=265458 RepID=UPI0012D42B83|nr:uncharacterized protein LOC116347531 [Contarinia nasturtii]
MNISQQTNGAHVAATNMTTLLQKNCIKTLSVNNGVVVMGTAPIGNAPMINANVVPITTNVTATNLQTHTMIANASHIQPIQAIQYQQLQAVTQAQPQYIIYNPSDGSMFRPVVTTTAPVNAIVTSSLYQPQQQTFVTAQNHLPKIGAIKATTLCSGGQQKVLNIVAPQKQQKFIATTTAPATIQNTNTIQHIKTEHSVTHPIIQNGSTVTTSTTHNIINTTPVASQIISSRNQSPAILTESIKSEALVTSSFVSKAATSNTNVQIPNIATTNTVTTSNAAVVAATAAASNAVTGNAQQNNRTNTMLDTNKTVPKTETIEQPAVTTVAPVEQPTNENNDDENEPEPEIDIVINNVVCSFSVRCHLNLREIALNGRNVEFRRENGMVTMKLRRPYTTASIWSSGRITCTGATSEDQAKVGARRYARCLQGLGFPVRFNNFRVVNVLGTCSMPWAIKIVNFSEKYKKDASYEPELHPGVTYKLKTPKATLKIFSTGSITVTAGSVADVQAAIEHIFPLVYEFRKKRTPVEPVPAPVEVFDPDNEDGLNEIMGDESRNGNNKIIKNKAIKRKYPFGMSENDPHIDNMIVSDGSDDDMNDLEDDDDL